MPKLVKLIGSPVTEDMLDGTPAEQKAWLEEVIQNGHAPKPTWNKKNTKKRAKKIDVLDEAWHALFHMKDAFSPEFIRDPFTVEERRAYQMRAVKEAERVMALIKA